MHIRPFELGLIGIFLFSAIVGLIVFSKYQSKDDERAALYGESVQIWGTFDARIMNTFLEEMRKKDTALDRVKYTRIDQRNFENELVNAIAEGRSPDLVILPHNLLVTMRTKLQAISGETLPIRTFKDTYVDGAEIFLRSDGVYGIPFAVDPLVMYWNRDMFSSAGLAQPPKYWETIVSQTTRAITRVTDAREISQSAIAFGEYTNVTNAKDILAMLLLQAGSTIVEERGDRYAVTLETGGENSGLSAGEAVFTFYAQFAKRDKDLYSWNQAKPNDREEFLGGKLALYFGKGSELSGIELDNPNLNFDVAPVPQGEGVTTLRNYGDFYAFSIPRASKNIRGAYMVATLFAQPENAEVLVRGLNFAPVTRSGVSAQNNDPFKAIIYQSALISRGWLDPAPRESGRVFREAVANVIVGEKRLQTVVYEAVKQLESLF